MNQHYFEIFPNDKYVVLNRHKLTEIDRKVIQLIYQPLIGLTAVSLYFSLLNELMSDQMWSKTNTHSWLLDTLDISMSDVLIERKKLEGIGLLRSWEKQLESTQVYIYEVQAPLSPEAIFHDELLATFLLQKVGNRHFEKLQEIFGNKKIPEGYQEITASFIDVFSSVVPSKKAVQTSKKQFFTSKTVESTNYLETFDFELLFALLKNNFFKVEKLTTETMNTIAKLAFIYSIDVLTMRMILIQCVNPNQDIDLVQLKTMAREHYLFSHDNRLPKLSEKILPITEQTITNPQSAEELFLFECENTSPVEFLAKRSQADPTGAELEIIENMLIHQKLNQSVTNVVIDYVLRKSDIGLNKKYVELITANLARKKINNAKQAMDFLKELNVKATEKTNKSRQKKVSKEIIPKWMEDEQYMAKTETDEVDMDALQLTLNQYRKGGKSN